LFLKSDYPPSAIRAREQGTVEYRIDIGEDGRVAACTITASSGSAALDSTTWRLVRWRARFRPAQDAAGKPKQTSMTGRVVWRLPEPAPVPPPS
jgi:protein TonB